MENLITNKKQKRIYGPKWEEGAADQIKCKMWSVIIVTLQYISNGKLSRKL
jgi:hypothetical protein